MSGAEAALVLGLVSSTLSILEAAYSVYTAAHDSKGLTKAFRAPAEQIPLVLHTLGLVESSLERPNLSAEAVESIRPILERCKENSNTIKDVFDKALPSSKDATRSERYKKAIEAKMKGGEVKRSMEAVMQDLVLLEQHQIFQDAETLEDIKAAINDISSENMENESPSFTHSGSGNMYNHSGSGPQENHTISNTGAGDLYYSKSMTIQKVESPTGHRIIEHLVQSCNLTSGHKSKAGIFSVPRSASRSFIGRQDELRRLEAEVLKNPTDDRTQRRLAITGIGGMGKSEICLQLANAVRDRFDHVFWVDVNGHSTAEQSFLSIARRLGLRSENLDEAVQDIASIEQSWLLIFDNADELGVDYNHYFPPGSRGTVVLTSRNPECGQAYGDHHWERLDSLDRINAANLLLETAGVTHLEDCKEEAQAIVDTLGCHTLAIVLAGAYIGKGHCSLHEYLAVYEKHWLRTMSYATPQERSRYGSVMSTFEASLTALELERSRTNADALDILSLLCTLATGSTPIVHFAYALEGMALVERLGDSGHVDCLSHYHVTTAPAFLNTSYMTHDMYRVREACIILQSLSLLDITGSTDERMIAMHPLIHEWLWHRQDRRAMDRSWEIAASFLSLALYGVDTQSRRLALQGHVQALLRVRRKDKLARNPSRQHLQALFQFAETLDECRDDYLALRCLDEIVYEMKIQRGNLQMEHLPLFKLWARSTLRNGDARGAVEIWENISLTEEVLSEDDPDRLASQHALAGAYESNGQLTEAAALLQQVVRSRNKSLPEHHTSRLASQHELARMHEATGEVSKAIELLEQVVQVRDRTLPDVDPDRLASQHALAGAYEADRQTKTAIHILEDVVRIRQNSLTEDHPDLLASQHELARAYETDGRIENALKLLEHIVDIEERKLPEHHPDRLASQHVLARVCRAAGQIDRAVELLNHVVENRVHLADGHPDHLASRCELAQAQRAKESVPQTFCPTGTDTK